MKREALWILVAVGLALVRSLVLGWLIPPYQSSDEPWHLDYARSVASGRIPVLGRSLMDTGIAHDDVALSASRHLNLYGIDNPPMSREATQPPLAYLVPAVGWAAAGSPRHALYLFRLFDALIGAALVVATWWAARAMFPGRQWAAPLAAATAVFLPSIAIVASTGNNDALATLCGIVVVGAAGGLVRSSASRRGWGLLGVGVGAAALVKSTGLALIAPALVAAVLAPAVANRLRWQRAVLTAVPAAALSAVWFVHNLAVYGDLTGTTAFRAFGAVPGSRIGGWRLLLGGRPSLSRAHRLWPDVFRSTVGLLRWSDLRLPSVAYAVAAIGSLLGLVAVARWAGRSSSDRGGDAADRRVLAVIVATIGAQAAGLAWFAMTVDYQPQGRYLLVGVLAGAAAVGAAVDRRAVAAASLVLLGLLTAAVTSAAATFGWP